MLVFYISAVTYLCVLDEQTLVAVTQLECGWLLKGRRFQLNVAV
jgi:hypothetical protein